MGGGLPGAFDPAGDRGGTARSRRDRSTPTGPSWIPRTRPAPAGRTAWASTSSTTAETSSIGTTRTATAARGSPSTWRSSTIPARDIERCTALRAAARAARVGGAGRGGRRHLERLGRRGGRAVPRAGARARGALSGGVEATGSEAPSAREAPRARAGGPPSRSASGSARACAPGSRARSPSWSVRWPMRSARRSRAAGRVRAAREAGPGLHAARAGSSAIGSAASRQRAEDWLDGRPERAAPLPRRRACGSGSGARPSGPSS